jgi:hypothetical protein
LLRVDLRQKPLAGDACVNDDRSVRARHRDRSSRIESALSLNVRPANTRNLLVDGIPDGVLKDQAQIRLKRPSAAAGAVFEPVDHGRFYIPH